MTDYERRALIQAWVDEGEPMDSVTGDIVLPKMFRATQTSVAAGDGTTRKPDGEFRTFDEWVDKARSWIGGSRGVACFDQRGRLCSQGSYFMRARDENAFPVVYFLADPLLDHQRSQERAFRERADE